MYCWTCFGTRRQGGENNLKRSIFVKPELINKKSEKSECVSITPTLKLKKFPSFRFVGQYQGLVLNKKLFGPAQML